MSEYTARGESARGKGQSIQDALPASGPMQGPEGSGGLVSSLDNTGCSARCSARIAACDV